MNGGDECFESFSSTFDWRPKVFPGTFTSSHAPVIYHGMRSGSHCFTTNYSDFLRHKTDHNVIFGLFIRRKFLRTSVAAKQSHAIGNRFQIYFKL